MNAVRGMETDPRMMMVVVIPVKEWLAKSARVLQGTEALGKLGLVFQSLFGMDLKSRSITSRMFF